MNIIASGITVLACLLLGANEGGAFLLDENCGTTKEFPSISRGVALCADTRIYSNPWNVLVLCGQNKICSGSLITSRFVLSAARCTWQLFGESSFNCGKVRLGENGFEDSLNTQEIDVDRKIFHPQFKFDSSNNDISLLRLAQEVQFSDYIRPICLPIHQLGRQTIPSFEVTGWAKTEGGLKILHTATLSNLGIEHCNNLFLMDFSKESQICAGVANADYCRQVLGAPLSAVASYKGRIRVFQLGISSLWTPTCSGVSVYTNVLHYIDWIKVKIDENSDFSN